MERLTARSPKNNMAYLVKVKPTEQDVESPYPNTLLCIMESFERLAQYEDMQFEITEVIARNIIAWEHSKDKKQGLLPEVFVNTKALYEKLTGKRFDYKEACEKYLP